MEFLIKRTSAWEEKPCEEAYKKVYLHPDVRTCATPEEFDKTVGIREGAWHSRGEYHRIITIDGRPYICRDFMREGWAVMIGDLDELIALYEKYGDLVITGRDGTDLLTLEIYDDYRE